MKREIIKNNCFGMIDGRLQQLPIGHVIECDNPNAFGDKARTIKENNLTLEVATPPVFSRETTEEDELRAFIFEKTGKKAAANSKIATLRKKAKALGWGE